MDHQLKNRTFFSFQNKELYLNSPTKQIITSCSNPKYVSVIVFFFLLNSVDHRTIGLRYF